MPQGGSVFDEWSAAPPYLACLAALYDRFESNIGLGVPATAFHV